MLLTTAPVKTSGPHAGEKVFDIPTTETNVIVHGAALLAALVAPLPKEALHVNKKLESIKTEGSKLHVTFTDAVIGADGIFGSARKHVLLEDASAHAATPAGFWDCIYLIPFEKAKEKLGAQYFTEHRQYGWCGDGAFIMHDVLDNGETVQCVLSAVESDQPKERSRPLTRGILEMTLHTWLDGPIAKNMMDVCRTYKMKWYYRGQTQWHRSFSKVLT